MNSTLTAPARRRVEDTARFYRALRMIEERIGGPRRLARCDGGAGWPERGVYFFFEHGEQRNGSGAGPRVVRVGTHALKSGGGASLWSRLCGHRGDLKKGGGNHRGSIFRLLVGAALAERDPELRVVTWGRGSSAPRDVRERETGLERRVSRVIGEMPLLWLAIDDPPGPASLRGYVERTPSRCSPAATGPRRTRQRPTGSAGIAPARQFGGRACGINDTWTNTTTRTSRRPSRGWSLICRSRISPWNSRSEANRCRLRKPTSSG